MFDLVANHPVATDPAFKYLTQLTMMMMMVMTLTMMVMTLTMMKMTVTMMMTTPDAADEATGPARTIGRPSQKPLFASDPRCRVGSILNS